MRIFVAGATGVMGRRLVPALLGAGHEVTGMTRSSAHVPALESVGGQKRSGRRARYRRAVARGTPWHARRTRATDCHPTRAS
ncbi:MAG: NAD-dependent epimerase/dehydratase family protein [Actinomycetota bacterium]